MGYSTRKPYQRKGLSPTEFFRAPARYLKTSVELESVFEKPYITPEYGDMHQSPNLPAVAPPVAGSGGLVCLFSEGECSIDAECFAGPEVKVTGGPQEAQAGYREPKIIKGDLVNVTIDDRLIRLVFNPTVAQNVIQVTFVDGWGKEWTETISVTCGVFKLLSLYFNINDSLAVYSNTLGAKTWIIAANVIHGVWPRSSTYLNYVYGYGSSWITPVDADSSSDIYGLALGIDSSDYPHVLAYKRNGANFDMVYFYEDGGGWNEVVIEASYSATNNDYAILVDGSDNTHIFLCSGTELRHYYDSGGWTHDVIIDESKAKQQFAACLVSGELHLKCTNDGYSGGEVWKKSGGSWSRSTITGLDVASDVSYRDPQLIVDANGYLYTIEIDTDEVAYTTELKLYDNIEGSWRETRVHFNDGSNYPEVPRCENLAFGVDTIGRVVVIFGIDDYSAYGGEDYEERQYLTWGVPGEEFTEVLHLNETLGLESNQTFRCALVRTTTNVWTFIHYSISTTNIHTYNFTIA